MLETFVSGAILDTVSSVTKYFSLFSHFSSKLSPSIRVVISPLCAKLVTAKATRPMAITTIADTIPTLPFTDVFFLVITNTFNTIVAIASIPVNSKTLSPVFGEYVTVYSGVSSIFSDSGFSSIVCSFGCSGTSGTSGISGSLGSCDGLYISITAVLYSSST